MNSKLWLTFAVGTACIASACSDFKVEDVPANYSLVVIEDEPSGENCPFGGKKFVSGVDMDRDGVLAVSEVVDIRFVCTGNSGDSALVTVTDVAPGESGCQFGGKQVTTGVDRDGDGTLSESEISEVWTNCSGTPVNNLGRVVKIATFLNQSCALLSDETVQCWGRALDGSDSSSAPVKVEGVYKVKDVAAGCALSSDGIVRCWDGLTGSPRAVPDLKNVTSIAGGNAYQMCAVLEDTSAVCWGRGDAGQLGNGSFVNSTTPQSVVDANGQRLMGVKKLFTGDYHTCALMNDATLRCWGWNAGGQLGLGDVGTDEFYNRANSVIDTNGVTLLSPVSDVALGYKHSCAMLVGGVVKCWGSNDVKQLGPAATDAKSTLPVEVAVSSNDNPVTKIAGGYGHTCASLADGKARCWGWNVYGQLGDANVERFSAMPVDVQGLTSVSQLVLGEAHSCATLTNGEVKCWGNNALGQFGNGIEAVNRGYDPTPFKVLELSGANAISAGYLYNCVLASESDGSESNVVKCWGNNDFGQMGLGTFGSMQRFPGAVQISADGGPLKNVQAIATGYIHACALLANGAVQCWGDNSQWQLGDTSNHDAMSYPMTISGINNATSIAVGHAHSCAILADNTIKCWGYNDYGQLGNGGNNNSPPTLVQGLSNVDVYQLALGRNHSCALITDGTVKCWGNNRYQQMGTPGEESALTPVTVPGIANAKQLVSGHAHSCALTNEGTVQCWGSNVYGESGQAITSEGAIAPTAVQLSGVAVKIATGYQHTCALLANGTVQCWGNNAYAQLGNDVLINSGTPVSVSGLTNVHSIVTGHQHTCALINDGTVQCWGGDHYGQLGRVNGNSMPTDAAFVIQ